MKFYVSGKLGDESITKSVMAAIKEAGHEITLDWTILGSLKPYDENVDACCKAAVEEVDAVKAADVFVIIPHNRGVGMFVELGVALACQIPVYAIITSPAEFSTLGIQGGRNGFLRSPLVKIVGSVEELLKECKNEI